MTRRGLIRRGYDYLRREGFVSFLRRSASFLWHGTYARTESAMRKLGLYYPAAEYYYRRQWDFDTDRYASPLNPFKIIWISPDKITHTTGRTIHNTYEERIQNFGKVEPGEWDIREEVSLRPWKPDRYGGDNRWLIRLLAANRFEDSTFYRAVEARFQEGCEWQDTEFYQQVIRDSRRESHRTNTPEVPKHSKTN